MKILGYKIIILKIIIILIYIIISSLGAGSRKNSRYVLPMVEGHQKYC